MSLCPFLDQRQFMQACDQTVDSFNDKQALMYLELVHEEFAELEMAACSVNWKNPSTDEIAPVVDGLIDLIYVAAGMLHSMGIDANAAWNEVQLSNMSKVDRESGKVLKRDDGKVLKPDSYFPPDLVRVVKESWGLK